MHRIDAALAPTPAMIERALTYLARMTGGDAATADKARRQLATWLAADSRHQAAWLRAERLWAADGPVTAALQTYLPKPAAAAAGRRALLRAFAGGGLALGLGTLLRWQEPQALYRLNILTARREVRSLGLPDGTTLDVDAGTRARVAYYRDARELYLAQGQVYLDVRTESSRPFVARTPWGTVRVVGTAFSVSARAGVMRVQVERGLVRVWGLDASGEGVLLQPGQMVRAGRDGLEPVREVQAGGRDAWRQGWLVFDATPLAEVVAQWNAWRDEPIMLDAEPALHALRVTGSFPAREPGRFLAALPSVLPVAVAELASGGTRISRAGKK
ncbi:FecR family protein [Achromobacter deleyi]|uniref:FecR family protein n=1 Tax=Achromobacter deleyi TaxID=1353891 RepID=UPI001493141E|nr:FecR domain-containing protein [Achromobacter deleyi]QVQ26477.1 FecR domain-containing protein [Achromobacter deleyi]UIP22048.1 FecR domain-containing protein [Achromobacter deleyi]